jgi:hypothetical protein
VQDRECQKIFNINQRKINIDKFSNDNIEAIEQWNNCWCTKRKLDTNDNWTISTNQWKLER